MVESSQEIYFKWYDDYLFCPFFPLIFDLLDLCMNERRKD